MSTHAVSDPQFPRLHAVFVLGCKVSRVDATALAGSLEDRGGRRAEDVESADVLLVHTCTVTDRADRDGRRAVRRLRRRNPRATLVVSGCLAERDPESLARMPEVDLVLGHRARADLSEVLRAREAGLLRGKIVPADVAGVVADAAPFAAPVAGVRAHSDPERTRAFLKIQDGCERRCAFCIMPSVRGTERSADVADVETEIRRMGEDGIPEVVLAGVHLANFGKDRGSSLLALLLALESSPPRCRVRLSSLEPMEAGEALLDLVASSRVVAPHLHLPLQSGSDTVLRRMRRGISRARFEKLVSRAFAKNARIHFATDLIVGFPGETDAEFEDTVRLVEELPLTTLHVFPFSPRSGTDAARWQADAPVRNAVVTERAQRLREMSRAKERVFALSLDGRACDVVALRGGVGLTEHYLEAPVVGAPRRPGERFTARLLVSPDGSRRELHPVDSLSSRE